MWHKTIEYIGQTHYFFSFSQSFSQGGFAFLTGRIETVYQRKELRELTANKELK